MESCQFGYYHCGGMVRHGEDWNQERDASKSHSPATMVHSKPGPIVHECKEYIEASRICFCSRQCYDAHGT